MTCLSLVSLAVAVTHPCDIAPLRTTRLGGTKLLIVCFLETHTGTPGFPMTISRSPSPAPGGGWSSPGLNINNSGRSSPATAFPGITHGQQDLWESSRSKNMGNRGYPAFETQNQGFFQRHMRRISNNLPRFNTNTHYAEKEKLQRGQWQPAAPGSLLGRFRNMAGRMGRKSKMRIFLVFLLLFAIWLFYHSRTSRGQD